MAERSQECEGQAPAEPGNGTSNQLSIPIGLGRSLALPYNSLALPYPFQNNYLVLCHDYELGLDSVVGVQS